MNADSKSLWIAIAGVVVLLPLLGLLAYKSTESTKVAPEEPKQPAPKIATPAPPADFSVLRGKWERTDTPYLIEITEAGSDGQLKAGYYNPQPIHVARAEAASKDGKITVFVELRDTNYPGCTYKLTYDKATDTLAGVYYQAAQQQEYEIAFARVKAQ